MSLVCRLVEVFVSSLPRVRHPDSGVSRNFPSVTSIQESRKVFAIILGTWPSIPYRVRPT